MSDTIPPRVFDSVSAAVENSLPPVPPPYAPEAVSASETAPESEPVSPPQKAPGKRTTAKQGGTTAHAGTARAGVKAKGTE
jgi:hypothetical protein